MPTLVCTEMRAKKSLFAESLKSPDFKYRGLNHYLSCVPIGQPGSDTGCSLELGHPSQRETRAVGSHMHLGDPGHCGGGGRVPPILPHPPQRMTSWEKDRPTPRSGETVHTGTRAQPSTARSGHTPGVSLAAVPTPASDRPHALTMCSVATEKKVPQFYRSTLHTNQ